MLALSPRQLFSSLFLGSLIGFSGPAAGALTPVVYETDSCQCKGQYDPKRISPKQVEDTLAFVRFTRTPIHGPMIFSESPEVYTWDAKPLSRSQLAERAKAERSSVQEKFESALKALKGFDVLPTLETAKQHEVESLSITQYFALTELDYWSASDPSVLTRPFNGEPLPKACLVEVESLRKPNNPSALRQWQAAKEAECKTLKGDRADEACLYNLGLTKQRLAKGETASEAALVMSWHNCANSYWRQKTSTAFSLNFDKVLEKAFGPAKCECEGTE